MRDMSKKRRGRGGPRRPRRGAAYPNGASDDRTGEWAEYGGERILVVGWTEGGAPFGLTEAEFEAAQESPACESGESRSRRLLERCFGAATAQGEGTRI